MEPWRFCSDADKSSASDPIALPRWGERQAEGRWTDQSLFFFVLRQVRQPGEKKERSAGFMFGSESLRGHLVKPRETRQERSVRSTE